MTDANYYVVATYGPYTRGGAQNVKWELDTGMAEEEVPVSVIIKHAAD